MSTNPNRFNTVPNAQERSYAEQQALMDEAYANYWKDVEQDETSHSLEEVEQRNAERYFQENIMSRPDTRHMYAMAQQIAELRKNNSEVQILKDKEDRLEELLIAYHEAAQQEYDVATRNSEYAYEDSKRNRDKSAALEQGIAAEESFEKRKEAIDYILGVMAGDIETKGEVSSGVSSVEEAGRNEDKSEESATEADKIDAFIEAAASDPDRLFAIPGSKRPNQKSTPEGKGKPVVPEQGATKDEQTRIDSLEQAAKDQAAKNREDDASEAQRQAAEKAKQEADDKTAADAAKDTPAPKAETKPQPATAPEGDSTTPEHAKRFARVRKLGRGAFGVVFGFPKKQYAKHQQKKTAKHDAILAADKELAEKEGRDALTGVPSAFKRWDSSSIEANRWKRAKDINKKNEKASKADQKAARGTLRERASELWNFSGMNDEERAIKEQQLADIRARKDAGDTAPRRAFRAVKSGHDRLVGHLQDKVGNKPAVDSPEEVASDETPTQPIPRQPANLRGRRQENPVGDQNN